MKLLATQFVKNGWRFEQLFRKGIVAAYRKTKGNAVSFEVIKIQCHNGFTIAGNRVEPAENYPRSESWERTDLRSRPRKRLCYWRNRFVRLDGVTTYRYS